MAVKKRKGASKSTPMKRNIRRRKEKIKGRRKRMVTRGRAKPAPGVVTQAAGSRGITREGLKRKPTATHHLSNRKNATSHKKSHAETTRRQMQRSNAGLAAGPGMSNAHTAPPHRSGPMRLSNGDTRERIQNVTRRTKTWDDVKQSKTAWSNVIHEHARRLKPHTLVLDGVHRVVDAFKTFHKSFHPIELTTGQATNIHKNGKTRSTRSMEPLHNELDPAIRGGGGSHVHKRPNLRGHGSIMV